MHRYSKKEIVDAIEPGLNELVPNAMYAFETTDMITHGTLHLHVRLSRSKVRR